MGQGDGSAGSPEEFAATLVGWGEECRRASLRGVGMGVSTAPRAPGLALVLLWLCDRIIWPPSTPLV